MKVKLHIKTQALRMLFPLLFLVLCISWRYDWYVHKREKQHLIGEPSNLTCGKSWEHQKKERKQFMFIFHFRVVGTTNWGVQDPHELIRYCSPIYVLCVSSHFWPFTMANLILENFNQNLGFSQTPPPLVGPNAQLFPKNEFDGSL